jgi:hypothetical protein
MGPDSGEKAQYASGNARTKDDLTASYRTDCQQDISLIGPLEHIASRPGTHGGKDRFIVFEQRDHQNADVWAGRKDLTETYKFCQVGDSVRFLSNSSAHPIQASYDEVSNMRCNNWE